MNGCGTTSTNGLCAAFYGALGRGTEISALRDQMFAHFILQIVYFLGREMISIYCEKHNRTAEVNGLPCANRDGKHKHWDCRACNFTNSHGVKIRVGNFFLAGSVLGAFKQDDSPQRLFENIIPSQCSPRKISAWKKSNTS